MGASEGQPESLSGPALVYVGYLKSDARLCHWLWVAVDGWLVCSAMPWALDRGQQLCGLYRMLNDSLNWQLRPSSCPFFFAWGMCYFYSFVH